MLDARHAAQLRSAKSPAPAPKQNKRISAQKIKQMASQMASQKTLPSPIIISRQVFSDFVYA